MNPLVRFLRAVVFLSAVAGLGPVLRWATTGTIGGLSTHDLVSLASAVAAGIAWATYGWLCLTVVLTVLAAAPGAIGRLAAGTVAGITSEGSRTLLRSALGVAIAAPLTAGIAHAAPAGQHSGYGAHGPATAGSGSQRVDTGRPAPMSWDRSAGVERASTVPITARTDAPVPRLAVPDRPTIGAPTRYTPIHPPPRTLPAKPSRPAQPTGPDRPTAPGQVVVRSGDTLWSLTARELGPGATDAEIATRWPQWHTANADLIGPDPDLIHPGQVLRIPSPADSQPTTNQEK